MQVPKVSIIVPAYNAEKFLTRCLNSVAAQTMPDFECIIVDDGSTDRTGEIAESFAKKDPRFRVVHQENGGVAVARQTGIDTAIGVYTIQFDADDWVETTILGEMLVVAEAREADMVICDFNIVTKNGLIRDSQRPKSLRTESVFGQIMQYQLHGSLWNKLIRRECYQSYDVHFIPDMRLLEDQFICLSLLIHPIKVEYVPKALYYYDRTQNPGSLLNKGDVPAEDWIRPLEMIANSTDISKVQDYYDNAILYIAYQILLRPGAKSDYSQRFSRYLPSIRRAKGYPLRVKLLVLLGIAGIRLPLYTLKRLLGKHCK